MTCTAFGNTDVAIARILGDISKVISFTCSLLANGVFCNSGTISDALVPAQIATNAPGPPWAALLVTMVYSSPLLTATSSILR